MSGFLSSVEGELNAIVKEYLEHLNLSNTVQAFEEECQKLGKPIQDNASDRRKDERIAKIQNELLWHFDRGECQAFFSSWEAHVTCKVREEDLYCQKLEYTIHLHFAVLPLRKKNHYVKEEADNAMLYFRHYLENRGSVLSQCTELIPYFALPYVSYPASHPSFKDLFEDAWVTKLRNQLEAFLWEHLKGKMQIPKQPRLVDIFNNNNNDRSIRDLNNPQTAAELHCSEPKEYYADQSKKLVKIQEDCHQLMTVASLLVTALESAVKGNMVDMDCVLSQCSEHFPDSYKFIESGSCTEDSAPKGTAEMISEPNVQPQTASSLIMGNSLPLFNFDLDFNKVKEGLCNEDIRNTLLLLQALRWRLTQPHEHNQKEKFLVSYVENDLLSLCTESNNENYFVSQMKSSNENVLQSISRFLNAFASFSKGRAYLCQNSKLLCALQDILLVIQPKDLFIQDMVLGALQKLSMRSISQSSMVEAGMIEWLINAISQHDKLTDYGLEYAAALLMNLCLSCFGKMKCEHLKEKLLLLLSNLLELNKPEIIPYVNGTLYSILSVQSIKQYAKAQGFEQTLRSVMKKSMPEAQKQLECVLKLFSTESENESLSSDDDNEDEEEVDLEPELNMNDPIQATANELSGEKLLYMQYSASQSASWSELSALNSKNCISASSVNAREAKFSKPLLQIVSGDPENGGRSSSVPLPPSEMTLHSSQNQQCLSEPVTPKLDVQATQMVRKIVGHSSATLVEAANVPNPGSLNIIGLNVNEYTVAFSSRPKIPRTPEHSPSTPVKRSQEEIGIGAIGHMSPKVGASSPSHAISSRCSGAYNARATRSDQAAPPPKHMTKTAEQESSCGCAGY